ncbi:MAG: helix-turn-helix domain-containing protein [Cyclobacteriaceae bacterium]
MDRYQLYDIDEPSFIKSVPNGKIEAWIINKGECRIWNPITNEFNVSKENSFFPATNKAAFFQIPENLTCLNIKFNLTALTHEFFQNFPSTWEGLSIKDLLGLSGYETIKSLSFLQKNSIDADLLDGVLKNVFLNEVEDPVVLQLVKLLENNPGHSSASWFAEELNMSTKTLERVTKKYFALSPKDLLSIFRFGQATAHLNKNRNQKFIDALAFGYYDQSHFVKECRKLTGYAPTDFFSKLRLPTTDLIFQ